MPKQIKQRRRPTIKCGPSMTKQSFNRECDINVIMEKYQKTGIINHVKDHGPYYADYDAIDFQTAMETIAKGQEMFEDLPSSVRKHFDNDPAKFMTFTQDPENIDSLVELGIATKHSPPPQVEESKPQEPKKNEQEKSA